VKSIKFIISGGGTGGHIYPALAIAAGIKDNFKNPKILFVGARGKMEMDKIPREGYPIIGLWISGFQRSFSFSNLLFPLKLLLSLIHSLLIILRYKPQIVIGTGGFASGPLLQVATWLNYPTLIQEQNSYPGITNRILSKKVNRICVAFDNMEKFFPKQKIRITGNPVRNYLIKLKPNKISKQFFDLDLNKKTLVIIGGSLGSKCINNLIKSELEYIMSFGLQIIWQCGSVYYKTLEGLKSNSVLIKPYINEMKHLYSVADFIISRAGAGSISELSCVAKPSLLIPSPNVSENHQWHNANVLAQKKAVLLIQEEELDKKFRNLFSQLVLDEKKQKELEKNLKSFALPEATKNIISEIKQLL
tara:strand:+ start:3665 stop:4747 length:1083 start_codon:yes stop_codon:yes gene_type:complete